MTAVLPSNSRIGSPVRTSRTLMVRSMAAVASRRPSGLKASRNCQASHWKVCTGRQVVTSQSRTVRSRPAETSRVPSGLKVMLLTPAVWPVREHRSCPVATCQRFTVLSEPPEASHWPSGLYATR